jgi:hypothetical protein
MCLKKRKKMSMVARWSERVENFGDRRVRIGAEEGVPLGRRIVDHEQQPLWQRQHG